MTKNKLTNETKLSPLARSIARGLKEAIAHKRGRPVKIVSHKIPIIPDQVDVKSIRQKLHMTQEEFTQFGFTIASIRNWESHRRTPEGPAKILLKVIEKNPKAVTGALEFGSKKEQLLKGINGR